MNTIYTLIAALTDNQTDRIIGIAEKFVSGIGAVAAIVLPALVLYFQKRNAKNLISKVDASTEASKTALNVANGHNEKIANLTEIVANSSQTSK